MVTADDWIDLRAPSGRLLGRYNPVRSLLEIRRGDEAVLFDLQRDPASPEPAMMASTARNDDGS